MKEMIHNDDNLLDSEITELVIRTKALILNNGNLLLANENDVLQFPGGHLDEGETLNECLKREIQEETGIEISDNEIEDCFFKVVWKNRDWPSVGKNRKCEIYYYVVKTDKEPNHDKINLTESEKSQNFKVDFVPLKDSIKYIEDNMSKNEKNEVISPDMINAIREYLNQISE